MSSSAVDNPGTPTMATADYSSQTDAAAAAGRNVSLDQTTDSPLINVRQEERKKYIYEHGWDGRINIKITGTHVSEKA
jgi:hypothetical protein